MLHSGRPADIAARLATRIVAPFALALAFAACGGGTTPTAGAVTPVPSGTVAIEAKEYAFTPSTITVAAGSVTFSIKNVGTQDHELEILKGDQVVDKVEAGHDQLGMKGTLTVTGT